MAVAIFVYIIVGDGLAPMSSSLEIDMVDVCAGIDNVDIDAVTSVVRIKVFVESSEAEALTM